MRPKDMKHTLLIAATLLLLAGCGTTGGDGDMTGVPDSPTTDLTVTVKPGAEKAERTYTLRCDPPGGDHPDPEAACRLLDRLEEPFAPVPPDTMCTEIYGGDQTATVTGTFRGEPVQAEFSRVNGCEIDRWDKHLDLLVEPGGVDTP